MYKKCKQCNSVKDIELFSKNKSTKDGLQSYCKICTEELRKTKYRKSTAKAARAYFLRNKSMVMRSVNLYNQNRDYGLNYKYLGMRRRCNCKSQDNYKYYGGKGISVEWNSYIDFKNDMYDSYLEHLEKHGHKETTIDRIDSNKNYSKENCRWATLIEQQDSSRKNKLSTS